MTYTVIHENPLQNISNVDVNYDGSVFITYDNSLEEFRVSASFKNLVYTVHRGELVRDTCKYTSEVIDVLLSQLSEEGNYLVCIGNTAFNSIHLVCEGNRNLF